MTLLLVSCKSIYVNLKSQPNIRLRKLLFNMEANCRQLMLFQLWKQNKKSVHRKRGEILNSSFFKVENCEAEKGNYILAHRLLIRRIPKRCSTMWKGLWNQNLGIWLEYRWSKYCFWKICVYVILHCFLIIFSL